MAKVAIIGAGFAGQTAALYLGDALGAEHEITVINRLKEFSYVPSWVWVGIGRMPVEKTMFPLEPVYRRSGVRFVHGRATQVLVDERTVVVERDGGGEARVDYDHLIVATGPKLDFEGTEGLGPEAGYSQSICTGPHAVQARDAYLEEVARLEKGERRRFVIGTGHPGATCQGAAFEYITNVHKDLVRRGVRDKADLLWLSNEQALGDFGVRGVSVRRKGRTLTSEEFISAVFKEYGISSQVRTGVLGLTESTIAWEDFEGQNGETGFDFSMLIPRFLGQPLAFTGKDGEDVSGGHPRPERAGQGGRHVRAAVRRARQAARRLAARLPEPGPPGDLRRRHRLRAAGADHACRTRRPTAPPSPRPPPRTGMVSGIIGRVVALNIIDLVKTGTMTHGERMTEMYAACIASMGDSLWDGSAAVIMIYPVVPDHVRYPNDEGRDLFVTHMEMGLAGAWMKRMIQTTFMHKLRRRAGWRFIPE